MLVCVFTYNAELGHNNTLLKHDENVYKHWNRGIYSQQKVARRNPNFEIHLISPLPHPNTPHSLTLFLSLWINSFSGISQINTKVQFEADYTHLWNLHSDLMLQQMCVCVCVCENYILPVAS